jgi:hypothetical protein
MVSKEMLAATSEIGIGPEGRLKWARTGREIFAVCPTPAGGKTRAPDLAAYDGH